jgi:4a-hydroxytetrahydrobiopterin dehydratase
MPGKGAGKHAVAVTGSEQSLVVVLDRRGTMGGMAFDSSSEKLSRQEASDAVTGLGWRYVLGELRTEVRTGSLPLAADVAARAAAVPRAQGHLRMDVRADRVLLSLQTAEIGWVTARDVELARRISVVTEEFRLTTTAGASSDQHSARTVQVLEIGIDALDIASIRPFWKAVLGYADEPGRSGPQDALVDPFGQGPSVWFQQMDAPRPQRNRLHFDVSVPHDEAHRRRSRPAASCSATRRRRPSGCWPTPRATRPASRPGRAATRYPC